MNNIFQCTIVLVFFSTSLLACPVCNTDTGAQVREGIFNAGFIPTLLLVLAPFFVLIPLVLLLHFGLPRWWRNKPQQTGYTQNTSCTSSCGDYGTSL